MVSWPMCSPYTFYRSMIPSEEVRVSASTNQPSIFGIQLKHVCWRHPNNSSSSTLSTLRSIHGFELNSVRINVYNIYASRLSVRIGDFEVVFIFRILYHVWGACERRCVGVCVYDEQKYELRDFFSHCIYLYIIHTPQAHQSVSHPTKNGP